jgi:hypothetical protein
MKVARNALLNLPLPLGEGRGEGNGHGEQRLSSPGVALVAMAVSLDVVVAWCGVFRPTVTWAAACASGVRLGLVFSILLGRSLAKKPKTARGKPGW